MLLGVGSNVVWSSMTVDEAVCESVEESFSRITYKKGKSKSRISVYANKDKVHSFP